MVNMEDDRCRSIQRTRVRDLAWAVNFGLQTHKSREWILDKIDEQDHFWRDGLKMSECPTDLEIDNVAPHLKRLITKLVV